MLAAVELGRRTLRARLRRAPAARHRRDSWRRYLLPQYGSCAVEQFGIVMLDTKHRVIRIKLVSIGSLDTTVVHPREVFREAASASAAAIVLFHNHPSGDPTPSPDDLVLTTRMVDAGDIMGIDVARPPDPGRSALLLAGRVRTAARPRYGSAQVRASSRTSVNG